MWVANIILNQNVADSGLIVSTVSIKSLRAYQSNQESITLILRVMQRVNYASCSDVSERMIEKAKREEK